MANVNDLGPAGILYDLVKAQLGESASMNAIEATVCAVAESAAIPEAVVNEVLARFRAEVTVNSETAPTPLLLVDWGDQLRVGYQVSTRPETSP